MDKPVPENSSQVSALSAVAIAPDDRASRAHHGTPHAVMGPSGAGKSTFLDAICQRTPSARLQGQVTVNGSTDYDTRELFSFVEQDDALLGVLTVKETVTFAAHLACVHRRHAVSHVETQSLTTRERTASAPSTRTSNSTSTRRCNPSASLRSPTTGSGHRSSVASREVRSVASRSHARSSPSRAFSSSTNRRAVSMQRRAKKWSPSVSHSSVDPEVSDQQTLTVGRRKSPPPGQGAERPRRLHDPPTQL